MNREFELRDAKSTEFRFAVLRKRVVKQHVVRVVHLRVSIVVSISACHADDPGSIPGRGIFCIMNRVGIS